MLKTQISADKISFFIIAYKSNYKWWENAHQYLKFLTVLLTSLIKFKSIKNFEYFNVFYQSHINSLMVI